MIFRETFRVALAVLGALVVPLIAGVNGGWAEALFAAIVTYVVTLLAWPPRRD